mmetsp:Transcript_25870/g.72151  ORF Transcript_25870/g.72151 Transcript_25870/m.72151 type:complete len:710 (-) Transcript_25870:134-2263(-)
MQAWQGVPSEPKTEVRPRKAIGGSKKTRRNSASAGNLTSTAINGGNAGFEPTGDAANCPAPTEFQQEQQLHQLAQQQQQVQQQHALVMQHQMLMQQQQQGQTGASQWQPQPQPRVVLPDSALTHSYATSVSMPSPSSLSFSSPSLQQNDVVDTGTSQRIEQQSSVVEVAVCGRHLELDAQACVTFQVLQNSLRKQLAMHGQEFEIVDVHGSRVVTDGDLQDAIAERRLPLVGALHEASIHYIENRREELSQMQWKLIRDQLGGLTDKVVQLARRVQEMGEALSEHRKDQERDIELSRNDCAAMVDQVEEGARQRANQVSERVDATSQMVANERNVREAALQSLERQVQSLRDAVEADRSTRRTEHTATMSMIQEVQRSVLEEGKHRSGGEDRIGSAIAHLTDRMDSLSRQHADNVQDFAEHVKRVETKTNNDLQDHAREGVKVRSSVESIELESRTRHHRLEDRASVLESRLQDFMRRQTAHNEDFRASREKLSQTLDQVDASSRSGSTRRGVKDGVYDRSSPRSASPPAPIVPSTGVRRTSHHIQSPVGSISMLPASTTAIRNGSPIPRQPMVSVSSTPPAGSAMTPGFPLPAGLAACPAATAMAQSPSLSPAPPPHFMFAGVHRSIVGTPSPAKVGTASRASVAGPVTSGSAPIHQRGVAKSPSQDGVLGMVNLPFGHAHAGTSLGAVPASTMATSAVTMGAAQCRA